MALREDDSLGTAAKQDGVVFRLSDGRGAAPHVLRARKTFALAAICDMRGSRYVVGAVVSRCARLYKASVGLGFAGVMVAWDRGKIG